jgi:hypothetical protein
MTKTFNLFVFVSSRAHEGGNWVFHVRVLLNGYKVFCQEGRKTDGQRILDVVQIQTEVMQIQTDVV